MKIFRIISIIAIIIIIAGVSYTGIASYDTMETAKSISVSNYKTGLSNNSFYASAIISGKDTGFFSSKIIINNYTLNFKPGVMENKRIYFNETFNSLMDRGFPVKNISIYKNISINVPSYLFNASSIIINHYNLGAPFYNFSIIKSSKFCSNKTTDVYNITVSFHDYLNYNISKINGYKPSILILYNNSYAGIIKNITLSYNRSYTYNGTLKLPVNVNHPDLAFVLPVINIKWEEKNVTIN